MRKLVLSLIVAILAVGANAADWYLVGSNFGWEDAAENKFEATDDPAVFTKEVASLSGTIKIKEGGSSWLTSFGSNGGKLQEGVSYNAVKDGGDISVDGNINDATITINTTDYTILVTGSASGNEYSEVYLVGDFGSGWSESITAYPLTTDTDNGTTFKGTYELTAATTYFKMKAGSNVYGTGTGDVVVAMGTNYTAKMSGSAYSLVAGEYNFTFELEKNADTGVLTVTKVGGGDDPEYPTYYFVGAMTDWGFEASYIFQPKDDEDGVFTLYMDGLEGEFKIAENGWNDATTLTANNTAMSLGQTYTLINGAGEGRNMALAGAATGVTLTLNLNDNTLKIEGTPYEITDYPVLYLRGNFNDWGATAQMTVDDEGIYTIELETLSDEFKISDATWTAANTFSTVNTAMELGQSYACGLAEGDDSNMALAAPAKDVKVTFDYNARTIVITGTPVETPEYPELYVTGDMFDWLFESSCMMQEKEGVYTLTLDGIMGAFKISAPEFPDDKTFSSGVAMTLGESYDVKTADEISENMTLACGAATDVTFTFDYNAKTLVITGTPLETPVYPDLYLRGGFNDWGTTAPMTVDENGVYTVELETLSGEFKIADATWTAANTFSSVNTAMEFGQIYECGLASGDNSNMALATPAQDVKVTFDYNAQTIVITGTAVELPVSYGIMGNIEGDDASVWATKEMIENEGKWTTELVAGRESAELLVVSLQGGSPKEYFRATTSDVLVNGGTVTLAAAASGDNQQVSLSAGSTYEFIFEAETGALTMNLKGSSGVENVAVEANEAVYYNMQGVRVENPVSGLYIVVRGNEISKELVK